MTWGTPICLRFESREAWRAARQEAWGGVLPDSVAYDTIGVVRREGEQIGADPETGEPIHAMEELPGWHVNLRMRDGVELPASMAAAVITPDSPIRGWA